MSVFHFVESFSSDPVERAIAARVVAILNNAGLTRAQRRALVQQAQHELTEHQRRRSADQKAGSRRPLRLRGGAIDPIAARRRELGHELGHELGRGKGAQPGATAGPEPSPRPGTSPGTSPGTRLRLQPRR
jgi:hypothetical protein